MTATERNTLPVHAWEEVIGALRRHTSAGQRMRAIRLPTETAPRFMWLCSCGAFGSTQDLETAKISADLHAEQRHGA